MNSAIDVLAGPGWRKIYVSGIPEETTDFAFVSDSFHVTTQSGTNQGPTNTSSKCVCFKTGYCNQQRHSFELITFWSSESWQILWQIISKTHDIADLHFETEENYRSGTVSSNTVNSKFYLIQSFFLNLCQIPIISCLKCIVNSNTVNSKGIELLSNLKCLNLN